MEVINNIERNYIIIRYLEEELFFYEINYLKSY